MKVCLLVSSDDLSHWMSFQGLLTGAAAKRRLQSWGSESLLEQTPAMDDPELRDKEFLDMFRQIDTDGSKSLSLGEIILFLKSITNDISEENIEKIFNNLDKSGDRSVDFEEFKVRYIFQGKTKV